MTGQPVTSGDARLAADVWKSIPLTLVIADIKIETTGMMLASAVTR